MSRLTRLTSAAALAGLAAVLVAAPAWAHPLGNFTINHYSEVTIAGSVVRVATVYDLAEIPTFQERQLEADDPKQAHRLVDGLASGLHLTVDGQPVPLRLTGHRSRLLPGQAGLQTMRLEMSLESVAFPATRHLGTFSDSNYSGHLGWREIVVVSAGGAQIKSATAPDRSISGRLTNYPSDRLSSPLDVESAHFDYTAGTSPVTGGTLVDGAANGFRTIQDRFSALVAARELTPIAVVLSMLTAMLLGALHALEPGHGKAVMAGYLVGTRGRLRDAAALGFTITGTHTAGVFALGIVTLSAAKFVTPERLYPVLNAFSGLLVLAIGAALLLRGMQKMRPRHAHSHQHGADPHTHNGSGHHHDDAHGHDHAGQLGRLGILGAGISGGLIPCPSALVVLLAAVSLHRLVLGLALIVAFSLGLAVVLTGIGMALASSRGLISRITRTRSWGVVGRRAAGLVPLASALVVSAVGVGLTAQALQTLR